MFEDKALQKHLETSPVIRSQALVIAEWNMNVAENISQIGNYRYRPTEEENSLYKRISTSFDPLDEANFYTGATDADVVIDGGYTTDPNNPQPIAFTKKKDKEAMLYSLEDCFGRFRPRSGINKLRFFDQKYTHHANQDMARRPRYYMGDRLDKFKYWSSYRTENGIERGIAKNILNEQYYIDDAAPYVIYENDVPTNRVVIKMQTNVGDIDFGSFSSLESNNQSGTFDDPLYGYANQTTPVRWKLQYLDNRNWVDAISFNPDSFRSDGTQIIGSDGYVEIGYGLIVPEEYRQSFKYIGDYFSESLLPDPTGLIDGTAYLVKDSDTDPGVYYVSVGGSYENFNAKFDWYLEESTITNTTNYVTDLVSPPEFTNPTGTISGFREFKMVGGLRVVVDTMNVFDSSFELIELSPRLIVDISDKVKSFSVKKTASDLGISGMPVGQLLASTGSLEIFDYDQAFFSQNTNSIVSEYTTQNIKVSLYDVVVGVSGTDYYVPIKTMYSEGFPDVSSKDRYVSVTLRDMFFHFESMTAPQILLKNASLSSAISLLLDAIGFSNYVFKRTPGESEMIIPFFSVGPDKSIAEVLSELAVSAQAAMFFDEDNNFVVMSKNYIMPLESERPSVATLTGSQDQVQNGVISNQTTKSTLANIMEISSQDNAVFNDGVVNYTTYYIQKSYSTINQASFIDRDKTWIYKPALLWEVTGDDSTKSVNDEITQQSDYSLGAIPLNSDLSASIPTVSNRTIINNTIDLGDGIYWLTRYNGYFYANGEIIKYDAVQYSIPGLVDSSSNIEGANVWISNVQEYQKYFASVPFNGKIYPTGLIRIYAEPNYEVIEGKTFMKNGPVAKHGRGQFGTSPVSHPAGLREEWHSDSNIHGVNMDNNYLFSTNLELDISGAYSDPLDRGIVTIDSSYGVDVPVKLIRGTDGIISAKSVGHGLSANEKLYFVSTGSLLGEIEEAALYYVKTVINDDEFTVSLSADGAAVTALEGATQSGSHSWRVLADVAFPEGTSMTTTVSIASPGVFTNASVQDTHIVYFSTTGALPTGVEAGKLYRIYSKPADETFTIIPLTSGTEINTSGTQSGTHTVHIVTHATTMVCSKHNLLPGDEVFVVSTDLLDPVFTEDTIFVVSKTGFSSSRFMVTIDGQRLYRDGDINAVYRLYKNITTEDSKASIVMPNVDKLKVGFTVQFISGLGKLAENTIITSIDVDRKIITISPIADELILRQDPTTGDAVVSKIKILDRVSTESGIAGVANELAKSTTRNGIIKNFLSNTYLEESTVNRLKSTQTGTIQSSALVMNGSAANNTSERPKLLSYVSKSLDDRFTHFGTRVRIVGQIENKEYRGQSPYGVSTYYTAEAKSSDSSVAIGGASGGLAVLLNPETNNGYYFEIMALTETSLTKYENGSSIHNVVFYKLKKNADSTDPSADAVPIKLWGGNSNIIVDDGLFTGQYRMVNEENPTVYDLSVEYEKLGSTLRFYLYINNNLIAVVDDASPATIDGNIVINNNMALFVRGSSRVMFENIYALTNNYSQNTMASVGTIAGNAFGDVELNVSNSFQKYALSGILQQSYLAGISSSTAPDYKLYFDEFGTIMREMAYFNVRYDKAYPALYSKIAETFNRMKGYVVSGFVSGSYGAEFLVFNATDSALRLDSASGNYLRILGVTFTQQSTHELTVDEYFSRVSDMSNPTMFADTSVVSPLKVKKDYDDIKFSRMTHGRNQFSLDAPYIQTHDDANNLMSWMISKIMKPRRSVGVKVFGMPTVQLGDILSVDYTNQDGINEISADDSRFVVYGIEYSRDETGPNMSIYLSEVV